MAHSTYELSSNRHSFFAQEWVPDSDIKALVCIVHGHGEYSGRYDYVAEFLNQAGIVVAGFDNYGHGKTGGKKGVIPSYDAVMDAVGEFLSDAIARYPEVPVILYGHSMGGNFVANYVLRRKPPVAGVILSSALLRLAIVPSNIQLWLGKLMLWLYPDFAQSTKLDPGLISRDPEQAAIYKNDPMIHDKMSSGLFFPLVETGEWAISHATKWKTPVLLHHGTGDKVNAWEGSRDFAEQVPNGLATLRLWDGLYHETHYEPERDEVLAVTRDWILGLL